MNTQFHAFKSELEKQILASGMTFNPSIDCRKDLVNFYGYTLDQVVNMSDDEVFFIMDRMEAEDKGYSMDDEEETLPEVYKDKKCNCGGDLAVIYVDVETRGDCEIYVCECLKCEQTTSLNYAEEWFEDYEEEISPVTEVETVEPMELEIDTRSLCELDFSVRTYNCLKRAGYETAQQLKDAPFEDILKVRNLGRMSIKEIEEKLNIKYDWTV
jgi:hypothetical protein